jgi:hypothetical protein
VEKVVEDSVGHIFVENTFVAEPLQVQLKALELDTLLVRNVAKHERSEVWLAGFRTDRSEFGTHDFDAILSVWVGVVEALELVGKWCSRHGKFESAKEDEIRKTQLKSAALGSNIAEGLEYLSKPPKIQQSPAPPKVT